MKQFYQVIVYVDTKTGSIYATYAFEMPEDENSEQKTYSTTAVGGFWEGDTFKANAWETYVYAATKSEAERIGRLKVEKAKAHAK